MPGIHDYVHRDQGQKWSLEGGNIHLTQKKKGVFGRFADRVMGHSSLGSIFNRMVQDVRDTEINSVDDARDLMELAGSVQQRCHKHYSKAGWVTRHFGGHGDVRGCADQVSRNAYAKMYTLMTNQPVDADRLTDNDIQQVHQLYTHLSSTAPSAESIQQFDEHIKLFVPREMPSDVVKDFCQKFAGLGFPMAQYRLALMEESEAVAGDGDIALHDMEAAAKSGVLPAQLKMESVYREGGLGQAIDPSRAHKFAVLASRRDDGAFMRVGVDKLLGRGTDIDLEGALSPAQSILNDADAPLELQEMANNIKIVCSALSAPPHMIDDAAVTQMSQVLTELEPRQYARDDFWGKLAEKGNPLAHLVVGTIAEETGDDARAVAEYRAASEAGVTPAMRKLEQILRTGAMGQAVDPKAAHQYTARAALTDDRAQLQLCLDLIEGYGTEKDTVSARRGLGDLASRADVDPDLQRQARIELGKYGETYIQEQQGDAWPAIRNDLYVMQQQGCSEEQKQLCIAAHMFEQGLVVAADLDVAQQLYADSGASQAHFHRAASMEREGNYDSALALYDRARLMGSDNAWYPTIRLHQLELADKSDSDIGDELLVSDDCPGNLPRLQFRLAENLYYDDVDFDIEETVDAYRNAADMGDLCACYRLVENSEQWINEDLIDEADIQLYRERLDNAQQSLSSGLVELAQTVEGVGMTPVQVMDTLGDVRLIADESFIPGSLSAAMEQIEEDPIKAGAIFESLGQDDRSLLASLGALVNATEGTAVYDKAINNVGLLLFSPDGELSDEQIAATEAMCGATKTPMLATRLGLARHNLAIVDDVDASVEEREAALETLKNVGFDHLKQENGGSIPRGLSRRLEMMQHAGLSEARQNECVLAYMFERGVVVGKDVGRAQEFYTKSEAALAAYNVGRKAEARGEFDVSMQAFAEARQMGLPQATYVLIRYNELGIVGGMPNDDVAEALMNDEQSPKSDARIMYRLAQVERFDNENPVAAAEALVVGADNGSAKCAATLLEMIEDGSVDGDAYSDEQKEQWTQQVEMAREGLEGRIEGMGTYAMLDHVSVVDAFDELGHIIDIDDADASVISNSLSQGLEVLENDADATEQFLETLDEQAQMIMGHIGALIDAATTEHTKDAALSMGARALFGTDDPTDQQIEAVEAACNASRPSALANAAGRAFELGRHSQGVDLAYQACSGGDYSQALRAGRLLELGIVAPKDDQTAANFLKFAAKGDDKAAALLKQGQAFEASDKPLSAAALYRRAIKEDGNLQAKAELLRLIDDPDNGVNAKDGDDADGWRHELLMAQDPCVFQLSAGANQAARNEMDMLRAYGLLEHLTSVQKGDSVIPGGVQNLVAQLGGDDAEPNYALTDNEGLARLKQVLALVAKANDDGYAELSAPAIAAGARLIFGVSNPTDEQLAGVRNALALDIPNEVPELVVEDLPLDAPEVPAYDDHIGDDLMKLAWIKELRADADSDELTADRALGQLTFTSENIESPFMHRLASQTVDIMMDEDIDPKFALENMDADAFENWLEPILVLMDTACADGEPTDEIIEAGARIFFGDKMNDAEERDDLLFATRQALVGYNRLE